MAVWLSHLPTFCPPNLPFLFGAAETIQKKPPGVPANYSTANIRVSNQVGDCGRPSKSRQSPFNSAERRINAAYTTASNSQFGGRIDSNLWQPLQVTQNKAPPGNYCANQKYSCLIIHVSPLSRKDSTAANPRQSSSNFPCPENALVSQHHHVAKGAATSATSLHHNTTDVQKDCGTERSLQRGVHRTGKPTAASPSPSSSGFPCDRCQ